MTQTSPRPPKSGRLCWWQTGVIYQIYPRSFKDSTGNGIGDLTGVIDKLDYLGGSERSLGIDAIWISPFYPSPMADFGYDVSDYCEVDPLFGDLATFDRLVAEAHKRGIRVIVDFVPNHTSDQHPWFVEARSSRNNPRRNWYIWRDGRADGSPPNNWGSPFGGPAWTLDPATGQYYLHQFLPEQPELNWREPDLAAAMMDVLRFWMDRGVDGFRMDVVGVIVKDAELRDNPIDPKADAALPAGDIYGRQLHHFNEDQNDVHEIIRGFRRVLDEYSDRVAIGELGYSMRRWVRYYGTDGDGLHLPFNFRLLHSPWEAGAIRQSVEELESALPSWAWPSYVLGSHDAPRLASRVGAAQSRVAAMLLLTLRGTPTLYQGDELGLENGKLSPDDHKDPQGLRLGPERSRDPSRTPMQWDGGPHAGFSSGEPWLPVAPEYRQCNVATQDTDPASILNLYRRLLEYRRTTAALHSGDYASLESGTEDCYTYLRSCGNDQCVVALNLTGGRRVLSLPGFADGRVALSTHLDRDEPVSLSHISLRPDEGLIIEVAP